MVKSIVEEKIQIACPKCGPFRTETILKFFTAPAGLGFDADFMMGSGLITVHRYKDENHLQWANLAGARSFARPLHTARTRWTRHYGRVLTLVGPDGLYASIKPRSRSTSYEISPLLTCLRHVSLKG